MMPTMGETGEGTRPKGRGRGIMLPGLRNAREDAGLSQEALEEATRVAGRRVYASTISELENLKRGAHGRTALVLAEALGVGVRELREERGT